jgi:hypothetical protein
MLDVGSGVWVEPEGNLSVLEGVLLLDTGLSTTLLELATLGRADNGLDFGRVDETTNVGVGDDVGWEEVVLLLRGWGGSGSVDLVKGVEGGVGPDDETPEVSTRSELEEVKGLDGGSLNPGNVAESLDEGSGLGSFRVEDDEGPTALPVAAVSELTLTSTELLGLGDLDDIWVSTEGLEESNGLTGLADSSGGAGENARELWDLLDAVTTSEDESWDGRSSDGGGGSETALVLGNFHVPLPPDLGGSKHTSGTALVTEGSLTGTVGTTT